MSKTRSAQTRKIYRKRCRKSACRGKSSVYCRRSAGCKPTKGTKKRKSYCRKHKNTRV